MLFGIPLETCQAIFYTSLITFTIGAVALWLMFQFTQAHKDGSDPWDIPVALALVIAAVSAVVVIVDGLGLLLYAIWN